MEINLSSPLRAVYLSNNVNVELNNLLPNDQTWNMSILNQVGKRFFLSNPDLLIESTELRVIYVSRSLKNPNCAKSPLPPL